jgi:hypothetical protein
MCPFLPECKLFAEIRRAGGKITATAAPSSPLRHIQPDTKMIQSLRGHSVEVVPLFLGRERRLMPVCGGSAVFYSFSDFAAFLR